MKHLFLNYVYAPKCLSFRSVSEEYHEKYTFNRRFFGTPHLRMTVLHKGCIVRQEILQGKAFQSDIAPWGLHHRIEIRRVIPLRMTRDLLGGGFFLLAVVRMTFGPFRYIRESLIGNKKVCSKSEQTFLLPMRKRSIRTR